MNILDRYLLSSFFRALLVIIMILLLLFSFIELLGQLDDIGTGNYHILNAVSYVIYTIPGRLFDLLPVTTMLGSVIGLGILADHNELLAMLVAGRSKFQICRPILIAGLLLMLLAAGLAEYIVPPLEQQAQIRRLIALSDTGMVITKDDLWLRHQDRLIRIGKSSPYGVTTDLDIYQRDRQGRLVSYTHSSQAKIINPEQWLLEEVEQKNFTADGDVETRHMENLTIDLSLNAGQLTILQLSPQTLSPSKLYQYIHELHKRGQNADHYSMVFWQRLCLPLALGAMMILALSLIFGPARNAGAGVRIMIATMVGIGLYLFNQIIGNLGLLFDLHPALTALSPIAATLALSIWLELKKN